MKQVFEFVAMVREGYIARQKFLHNRTLHGKRFNLLDRFYLKNDQPKMGVSKKLKLKYDRAIEKVVNEETERQSERERTQQPRARTDPRVKWTKFSRY